MISVSKILQELHSENIVKWANRIWLEWTRLEDYRKKSTWKWIQWHTSIQEKILLEWYKDYKTIWIEVPLENGYMCWRVDFIAEKNDIHYIFDFKSSEDIYLSQILQLIAYKKLYWECKLGIINLNTWKETIIELSEEEYIIYENILKWLYTVAIYRMQSKYL